jgi:glycosyltransferase involved in cell wall biosynthesis
MSVVFDISRLLSRARFETPTGIDRFELNYANWAIERFYPEIQFVANGPFGHRQIPRDFARSFVADIAQKWSSGQQTDDQACLLKRLVDEIEQRVRPNTQERSRGSSLTALPRRKDRPTFQALAALFWGPSKVPTSSLFIHVSHSGIHKRSRYDWLADRACQPLFYVHDLIPLLRPEFCRAGEADRHKARMETILRLHRLILCNSQTTARTLDELAEVKGLSQPFTAVLPPGLEETFLRFEQSSRVRTTQPYFVCFGTIEPRKNHALLLDVWRQLVERYGARAPRLVIAGRRGWDNAHVFSLLDNPTAFQGSVIEIAGLSDRSVAQLLAGASALLAPSHIEGYGMPVAEALALGTPVIASNIRAHREVSRGRAVLLDTLDGVGWLSAIDAHARWPRRNDQSEHKHWTWAAHFDALHRLLVSAKLLTTKERRFSSLAAGNPRPERLAGVESCRAI